MKNLKLIIFLKLTLSLSLLNAQRTIIIDGSLFFGLNDSSIECEVIPCIDEYNSFVGVWEGPFQGYDKETKKMRPYNNVIIYDSICYRNIENNDIFIVGKRTDTYPAFENQPQKTVCGIIITGMKGGDKNKPFLKTIDNENGVIVYQKIFTETITEMSIWRYVYPACENQPQMTFTITDFRELASSLVNKRFVYISMIVGADEKPYWKGIITKGYHTKTE